METFQIKDPLLQSFVCKGFQIVSSIWNNLPQLISFFCPMKRMRKWPSTSDTNQILVALLNLIRTDYQSGRSFCCFIHWVKKELTSFYQMRTFLIFSNRVWSNFKDRGKPKNPTSTSHPLAFSFFVILKHDSRPDLTSHLHPQLKLIGRGPPGHFLILEVGIWALR